MGLEDHVRSDGWKYEQKDEPGLPLKRKFGHGVMVLARAGCLRSRWNVQGNEARDLGRGGGCGGVPFPNGMVTTEVTPRGPGC